MLSDILYGNLTAISMPNLWLDVHIAANASYIAWKKLTPLSSSLILRRHERVEGCTDVGLSTQTVRGVTTFRVCDVVPGHARRDSRRLQTTRGTLAPHGRLVVALLWKTSDCNT